MSIQRLIQRVCNELDVERIAQFPPELIDLFMETAENVNPPTKRSLFFTRFIRLLRDPQYDDYHTISFKLEKTASTHMVPVRPFHLEAKTHAVKREIDVFHQFDPYKLRYYTTLTRYLDQFKHFIKKTLQKREFSNAWLKCWEMLCYYRLIPDHHGDDYTVFCNAEFPGSFIFAINHYIHTKTDNPQFKWFANSLWPGKDKTDDILGDEYGLYKTYRDHWLMNDKEATGDVMDKVMNDIIQSKLGQKVDLYTSDIGIGLDVKEMNREETIHAPLNLGQIVCALHTLKEGGNMICKMFLFFKPFTISLLYLLTTVFDECYICKPMTSRPGNSELYIVGKGYKHDSIVVKRLEDVLYQWTEAKMDECLVPIPDTFYMDIVYDLYAIYGRQIQFIEKNTMLIKREYERSRTIPTIGEIFHRPKHDPFKAELGFRSSIVKSWQRHYQIDTTTLFRLPS